MEVTSPRKTEKVTDFFAVFMGEGNSFSWPLASPDAATRFTWGTRLVLASGIEVDVYSANLLYSFKTEREQEVVARTPSGMPASAVDIVNGKK